MRNSLKTLPAPLVPYRPLLFTLLNTLFNNYRIPTLNHKDLMHSAANWVGTSDFQDDSEKTFEFGLEKVTESLEDDSQLNFIGRILTRIQLDILLDNRLKIGKFLSSTTTALEKSDLIKSPVFVVGMPRSGTTFLHNLLTLDEENFRSPKLWEIVDPIPPSESVHSFQKFIRLKMNEIYTFFFRILASNVATVHPIFSTNAEECMPILSLNMLSYNFNTMSNVRKYNDWLLNQENQTKAFIWHKKFLLSQQQNLKQQRLWLLKAPWHMNHLKYLLEIYPDAKIIVPHREPYSMLSSLSSLHARFYSIVSDDIHLNEIGNYQQQIWDLIVKRFVSFRKSKLNSEQIFDISFGLLTNDTIGTVKNVYKFLNLKLSNKIEEKMRMWLLKDEFSRGSGGKKHVYSSDWFGLNQNVINNIPSFKEYTKMFIQSDE